MLEDGKITNRQFMFIFVLTRLMLPIAYISFFDAPPWNQDEWISDILSLPMHILFTLPVFLLAQRFKNLSIIQSAEVILGPAGKLVGALYVWFFAHRTAIILRQFGEFLTTVPYQETPILVFIITTSIFAAYTVRQGIETICRVCEILFPIIFFAILLVIALVTKDMNLKNLTPVLENGILPVIYGAFIIAPRTTGILFLSMLMPYINIPKKSKTYLGIGYIIITVYFFLTSITTLALFGVEQAKIMVFPFYYTVRLISIGDFLERIDAIFVGIWVLGMFINTAINYYLAVLATAQLLKLQDYRSLALAIGTVIVSLAIFQSDSMIALNEFLSYKIYTWYTLFFIVALPVFLLLTAVIRNKGADSR